MKVYLYVRLSAADHATAEGELARLQAVLAERGWTSGNEYVDVGPGISGPRKGLEDLVRALRVRVRVEKAVVVTNGLWRLFRSPRRLAELGGWLWRHGVDLVALDEDLDTTRIEDHFRWEAAINLLSDLARRQRSEASKVGQILRRHPQQKGAIRPAAMINPLELKLAYEGTEKRRPLPISKMGPKLDLSETTVRKYVRIYTAEGALDPAARVRNLAAAGGPRKGGRPRNCPVDLKRLIQLWQGEPPAPSLRAIAAELGVSRATVKKELDRQRRAGQINDQLREERLSGRKPSR